MTILLVMNYSTLLDDTYEIESLALIVEMIKHGEKDDMTPRNLGGDGGLYFD